MTHLATHPAAPLDALGEGLILGTHVPILLLALLFLRLRLLPFNQINPSFQPEMDFISLPIILFDTKFNS